MAIVRQRGGRYEWRRGRASSDAAWRRLFSTATLACFKGGSCGPDSPDSEFHVDSVVVGNNVAVVGVGEMRESTFTRVGEETSEMYYAGHINKVRG